MNTGRQSRAGFVLTGGKSSRMGTDKAFLKIAGQTMLQRAVSVVGSICPSVAMVGDAPKLRQYGRVVADRFPGCGPLGGIHAALVSSSAELNLMLAVDMPFVTQELLAYLFAAAEKEFATVTLARIGTRFQPLCAIYRREFAVVAEAALRAGNYKIDALFSELTIRVIEQAELAAAGFSERNFVNVNTPADRELAENRRL